MAFAPAARPTNEELERVYIEGGYKVNPVKEHFKTGWNNAKKWLCEAGLTDPYGTRIIKAESTKGEEILDSVDAGKTVRSMGCVEPSAPGVIADATKPESTAPVEVCCRCSKPLPGLRVIINGNKYCSDCDTEMFCGSKPTPLGVVVPNYEPEDNDFVESDDELIPCQVAETFDACRFKLELIQSVIEVAELRKAPKDMTLNLISGIIGS